MTDRTFARRFSQILAAAAGLLLVLTAQAAETVTYYHTDALGTPVMESNAAGTVTYAREHKPYGEQALGAAKHGPGFTGHVGDADTGLTYMQARYFDPAAGRFMSNDPIAADFNTGTNYNRYWYANNNPYTFIDPDGRRPRMSGLCDWAGGCESGSFSEDQERESIQNDHTAAQVGAAIGATVAVVAAAGCDYATVGGCIAANPSMIGGGAVAGALTGEAVDRAWTQLVSLVEKAQTKTGGNEIQYALVAERSGLYPSVRGGVVQLDAGEVWKYGTTADPAGRYPVSALAGLGLQMIKQSEGTMYQMLAQEKIMLINYAIQNGRLPPGNRIFK